MLKSSVREARNSPQRVKLSGYQAIGKQTAKSRTNRRKPLDIATRLKLDHKTNSYQAFIHVDDEDV